MQFYTKDDSGGYVEATDSQVEELFQARSEKIIAKKLAIARERQKEEIRPEIEEEIRKEFAPKLEAEAQEKAEGKFKAQLDEANNRVNQLDVALRRKTIAAEYGFKPETEQFLGDGTEEDMRAKADTLKNSFGAPAMNAPEKTSTEPVNKLYEETGLDIKV